MATRQTKPQTATPFAAVNLHYRKSTKGTYVYGTEDPLAAVKTLYVTRTTFAGEPPERIRIELSEIE